jgi:hypothetical protein
MSPCARASGEARLDDPQTSPGRLRFGGAFLSLGRMVPCPIMSLMGQKSPFAGPLTNVRFGAESVHPIFLNSAIPEPFPVRRATDQCPVRGGKRTSDLLKLRHTRTVCPAPGASICTISTSLYGRTAPYSPVRRHNNAESRRDEQLGRNSPQRRCRCFRYLV